MSPTAEAYSAGGVVLCRGCAALRMADPLSPIPTDAVNLLSDPTICSDCHKDNGDNELPRHDGRALCRDCRSHRKRVQFPWLMRAACLACVVLGVWGICRSIPRALAIHAYCVGIKAFQQDDYWLAAESLHKAVRQMPEDSNFQDLEAFYRGHACYADDDAKGAVLWFKKSFAVNPQSQETEVMLRRAERKVAFEAKDFTAYFRASQALLEADEHSASSVQAMATAWACRYVLTGKEEFREKALACLKEARELGATDQDDANWVEAWVQQMLDRRSILSFREFWYSIGKGSLRSEDFG